MQAGRRRALCAAMMACALAPAAAHAAEVHVTSSADDGPGSLRAAVATAEAGDTVIIDEGVNPVLDTAVLAAKRITIRGQGARDTTIRGAAGNDVIYTFFSDGPSGRLTVQDLRITGGRRGLGGFYGGLTVERVQVDGTSEPGIVSNLPLDVRDTTVAGNGGGIVARHETLIENSTIVDNHGAAFGGVESWYLTRVSRSTLARNSAGWDQAGANLQARDGTVTVDRSVIAEKAGLSSSCGGWFGGFASTGGNVVDEASCAFSPGDVVAPAGLGDLGDFGGPTDTVELLEGSPAIDVEPLPCDGLDQRGLERPYGDGCDAGAFERQPVNTAPECSGLHASPAVVTKADHKLVPVTITGAIDADGDGVRTRVQSVQQDEPVNGAGDGDTSPDAVFTGPHDTGLQVRAERAGPGDGRVYVISVLVTDGTDSCTGEVTVSVPKQDKRPAADSGARFDSFG